MEPKKKRDDEWEPEREKVLEDLWDTGLPTAGIGIKMGITKNSVIGKARRMGLPARPNPARMHAGPPRKKAPKKSIEKKLKPRPKNAPLVPLIELKSNQCHWPFGDPSEPDYGYCGQEVCDDHPSYCEEHRALGTIKNKKNRKPRG